MVSARGRKRVDDEWRCVECGNTFKRVYDSRITCSMVCYQKFYREYVETPTQAEKRRRLDAAWHRRREFEKTGCNGTTLDVS